MSRARHLLPVALVVAGLIVPAGARAAAAPPDLAAQVSPLAGTTGSGFPMVGASVPFGMIQPGPDTALPDGSQSPVNYDGYAYHETSIRGFSLTHFDGAGIKIAGDLPFMPVTGQLGATDPAAWSSPYDHGTEVAQPGYYAVTLARYATRVELTATTRAALMRISYPGALADGLILHPGLSIDHGGHASSVQVAADHRGLSGFTQPDVGAPLHFDARFDTPFTVTRVANGDVQLSFGAAPATGRIVALRVAISYVDQAGASANLAAELPDSAAFDDVRAAARTAWNAHLANAQVQGGDPGMAATYYTNLYRAMLMPSIFEDADGRYIGLDSAVHTVVPGTHHLTALSSWDTYRTQTPLFELIEPKVARDLAVSLTADADQNNGVIPRWTQSNNDRGIMGGDSGSATLAEAVVNGDLSGAEARHAYNLLLAQATTLPGVWPRENLGDYVHLGYIPFDHSDRGAAVTTEYAIDDNSVSEVAARLGDGRSAAALRARAGSWRNLLDPATRFIRPRNSDGTWANPTNNFQGAPLPAAVPWSPDFQDGYQEGTGWQYQWAAPQDVAGLASEIGSRAQTLHRLDTFFSEPLNQPLVTAVPTAQQYTSFFGIYYIGDQFTPANEPDLWAPFYYDWLGQPWKTQRVLRSEMGVYNTRPDGMPGNDDTGTMSAWYVLSALGVYHAAPGTIAWELASPAFSSETLHLGGGRTLTVNARGAGGAMPYVQSVSLADGPLDRAWLSTCELEGGGSLNVTLGATPSSWATGPAAAPPSLSDASTGAPAGACAGYSNGTR